MNLSLNVRAKKIVRAGRKQTYGLNVSSIEDIKKVILFFENESMLLGYKKEQFENWKKAWLDKYSL